MGFQNDIRVPDNLAANQYLREEWQQRIKQGDGVLERLSHAHGRYRDIYKTLSEGYDKRDPELTEDGHFMALRGLGHKSLEKAAKIADEAHERAEIELDAMRSALKSQLGLVENHRAGEIRGLLRTLKENERNAILQNAVANKDSSTLAAVLEAPSFLSGVSPDMASSVKQQYEERYGGDLPARMKAIEKAMTINRATGDAALRFHSDLFPRERVQAIESRQAAAKAMRERLNEA